MVFSIIIINFQSRQLIQSCLNSIDNFLSPHFSKNNFEVIIFNNDKEKLTIKKIYPFSLKTIEYGKNIGFGRANNLATEQASGGLLFFLNPDTKLLDDSLENLIEYLKNNSSLGAVGLKIIEASRNRPQPWTSGSKTSLWNILFRNTFNKPWNKKNITSVDWVSGTALMVRKKDFQKINGFDEKFFMYFEDQDLCLRLKALGKKNIFYPMAKILHFNGQSWSNNQEKKKKYFQSQDYFFQKHHPSWQSFLLKKMRIFQIF